MYQKIKKYLEISPREFRGMVVFVIILLIIFISPYIYERLMFQPLKISVETLAPKIEQLAPQGQEENHFYPEDHSSTTPPPPTKLFKFDPNGLPVETWMKLGLTERQALGIKKYEAKGGKFRTLKDVQKMYTISPKLYEKLAPYIVLPQTEHSFKYEKEENKEAPKTWEAVNVELNSADSATLTTIRGVGPSFASRILKYRKKLGGFISEKQLKEIYGIDSVKYEEIKTQVNVDLGNFQKKDINHCSLADIRYFPYLTFKQANAIIAYREQHGDFSNASDLNKIAILNPEVIQKITPYFKFK